MIREPGTCATDERQSMPISDQGGNSDYVKEAAEETGSDVSICEKLTDVIERLRQESRYADLLIIDPATSFSHTSEDLPTSFVREVLRIAECPVLIAPQFFDGIDDIVFCYDGSASSVFAIRQFIYLFPEYSDKNAIILHVSERGEAMPADTNSRIHSWLKPHFSSVNFHVPEGHVEEELAAYFSGKEKCFVVMGAYGRSFLSSFFRKSASNRIIGLIDLPLFITHH